MLSRAKQRRGVSVSSRRGWGASVRKRCGYTELRTSESEARGLRTSLGVGPSANEKGLMLRIGLFLVSLLALDCIRHVVGDRVDRSTGAW
jgi:hypothetical protein